MECEITVGSSSPWSARKQLDSRVHGMREYRWVLESIECENNVVFTSPWNARKPLGPEVHGMRGYRLVPESMECEDTVGSSSHGVAIELWSARGREGREKWGGRKIYAKLMVKKV